jgi:hypothetical protein
MILLVGIGFVILAVTSLRQDSMWLFLLGVLLLPLPALMASISAEDFKDDEFPDVKLFGRGMLAVAGFGVLWGFFVLMLNVMVEILHNRKSLGQAYADFFKNLSGHLKAAYS